MWSAYRRASSAAVIRWRGVRTRRRIVCNALRSANGATILPECALKLAAKGSYCDPGMASSFSFFDCNVLVANACSNVEETVSAGTALRGCLGAFSVSTVRTRVHAAFVPHVGCAENGCWNELWNVSHYALPILANKEAGELILVTCI